jgi:hypothetical protein
MCVEPSISDKIRGDKTTDTHVIVISERSRPMDHTAITYLYVYAPGSQMLRLYKSGTQLQGLLRLLKQVIPVIFKVTGQETA